MSAKALSHEAETGKAPNSPQTAIKAIWPDREREAGFGSGIFRVAHDSVSAEWGQVFMWLAETPMFR